MRIHRHQDMSRALHGAGPAGSSRQPGGHLHEVPHVWATLLRGLANCRSSLRTLFRFFQARGQWESRDLNINPNNYNFIFITLYILLCVITFYATPKFPISDYSYDVQIWPLCFAPCLTHLFFPPCMYPSTRPHIQESDVHRYDVSGEVHSSSHICCHRSIYVYGFFFSTRFYLLASTRALGCCVYWSWHPVNAYFRRERIFLTVVIFCYEY